MFARLSYCVCLALLATPTSVAQTSGNADPRAPSEVPASALPDSPEGSALDKAMSDGIPPSSKSSDAIDPIVEERLVEDVDILFEDFDIVVTASRSEQSVARTPVPVSVLSSEEIRFSGVRTVPQILSFVPGVDALQVDRNRWSVGVRGLHQTFSDRTLFLLNGRNASSPIFGGVDFQTLPIFLDDIDRIETVRGPAGGAWGANAFNGVINIIEKDPRETTGVLVSQRLNEFGDVKTNLRFGDANDDFAWRLSGEYQDLEDSGTEFITINGPFPGVTEARDFSRTRKFGLDAVYDLGEKADIDFGLSHTHVERGDAPVIFAQASEDERIDLVRGHAQLTIDFDDGSSGYIQWYGSYQDTNRPSLWRVQSFDNTLEGQYSFRPHNDHDVTVGATLRVVDLDVMNASATDIFQPDTATDIWFGGFISDSWRFADRWTLESQARIDWYNKTHTDWAGRVALLHELDETGRHVLRFAGAKAFRTPQHSLREFETSQVLLDPGPPPLFLINFLNPGELDNEEIYSIELGYTGRVTDELTVRVDGYYQIYEDLTGTVFLPEPAPNLGRFFLTIDNMDGAEAYGIETEISYKIEDLTLTGWYAYNDFEFDSSGQDARAFLPSSHKVGARAQLSATEWLTLNANYRYTNTTRSPTTPSVKPRHRVDLTATFDFPKGISLQVGVLDVFDETDEPVFDQVAPVTAHETPGQTFFMQLQAKF